MALGAMGVTGLLGACGLDDGTGPSDNGDPDQPNRPAPDETVEPGNGSAWANVDDVPVGGGIILDSPGVVITQPTQGEFIAFSSTCTHQGCAVSQVDDGVIRCGCHGSQFSAADGSVQQGPAEEPLEEIPIDVDGDQIVPA